MAWTRRQLDEAVTAYELALQQAGRTAGTVTTYVGDARLFVEWLAGERDLGARPLTRGSRATRPVVRVRRAGTGSLVPPPVALRKLVDDWENVGVPRVGVTADRASERAGHRVILTTLE